MGVNALLSKYLGEKKHKEASRVAGNAIFTAICTYVVFLIFGLFFVKSFLSSQTSDLTVINLGSGYLSICCIFSFGAVGSMIYEKLLQSTGKTTLSTIAQLAGAITNIVLDPIMIYGWLGFPAMGVNGAAIATVIGQILTLVLDMVFHYTKNKEIDGQLAYLKPNKTTIGNIYKVGLPAIIMQALMSIMSYGINIIFGLVSAAAVTAFGIYYKVQQFVFFAAFGMNNAMIPIIAYNYGLGDKKRVKDGFRYGMLYTLLLMVIGLICLQLFAAPISEMFSLAPDSKELCMKAIHIVTLGYLFAGANIAYQGYFQALGCGVKSLVLSLIRLIIVTLPCAFLFAGLENAATMIWWAFPIGETAGFLIAICLAKQVQKQRIQVMSD